MFQSHSLWFQMIEIAQVEQSCVVRQVDGVHIPGNLLAIRHAMKVAHAGILGTEAPTGSHIARI